MKKPLKIRKLRKFDEEEYNFSLDRKATKSFLRDSKGRAGNRAANKIERQFLNDLSY